MSPTDPVSVVNVLKRIKAPERLTTILETEAYLNDATAVVLYPIAQKEENEVSLVIIFIRVVV